MITRRLLLLAPVALSASAARAFFVDGDGHYALRGETQAKPGFSSRTGTYQAIEQSFRLKGEARVNDQSSLFLEFHLFDDPRAAYLGDKASSTTCPESQKSPYNSGGIRVPDGAGGTTPGQDPCQAPSSGEPRYKPFVPQFTKAYVRYAFDYCIVEAGRRGRDWGLGILLDSGTKPFSTDASVFDGVTCDINIQKTQTLGLSVGYDKIAETGAEPDPALQGRTDRGLGAGDPSDDLDQYFFTIQYDDRKANAGAAFTKQVGVYFAQVSSRLLKDGGTSTDLKFLDLYTGFFFADLSLRNEILIRMGKSADPNWRYYGGAYHAGGNIAVNKLQSIGLAGELDWTLARSGAAIGPADYNNGTASRHAIFLNYAYAPGDSKGDGYKLVDERDTNVTAMAFHRNYKPALLLFNQHPQQDNLIVDGEFNPSRVENATVLGLGYRFESMTAGSFEAKLVTASLNDGIDAKGKETAVQSSADARPAGYFGKALGYELDLSYGYRVGREVDLGATLGGALPGKAWQVSESSKPANDFVVQTFAAFHF